MSHKANNDHNKLIITITFYQQHNNIINVKYILKEVLVLLLSVNSHNNESGIPGKKANDVLPRSYLNNGLRNMTCILIAN